MLCRDGACPVSNYWEATLPASQKRGNARPARIHKEAKFATAPKMFHIDDTEITDYHRFIKEMAQVRTLLASQKTLSSSFATQDASRPILNQIILFFRPFGVNSVSQNKLICANLFNLCYLCAIYRKNLCKSVLSVSSVCYISQKSV